MCAAGVSQSWGPTHAFARFAVRLTRACLSSFLMQVASEASERALQDMTNQYVSTKRDLISTSKQMANLALEHNKALEEVGLLLHLPACCSTWISRELKIVNTSVCQAQAVRACV